MYSVAEVSAYVSVAVTAVTTTLNVLVGVVEVLVLVVVEVVVVVVVYRMVTAGSFSSAHSLHCHQVQHSSLVPRQAVWQSVGSAEPARHLAHVNNMSMSASCATTPRDDKATNTTRRTRFAMDDDDGGGGGGAKQEQLVPTRTHVQENNKR